MVDPVYKDDLSETRHEIRLITIHPGAHSDELVCTLAKVSLDTEPQFEALSYAWGPKRVHQAIWLNDVPASTEEIDTEPRLWPPLKPEPMVRIDLE